LYGFNPHAPIDLLPLLPSKMTCFDASQLFEFILKMHETTKLNIEKMNDKYHIAASKDRKEVKLEPGDLVWLHLRKEQFLELRKSKLMSCAAGPFKFLLRSMIIHINLSCLPSSGLVLALTFQIFDLTWEKKMRCHRG
jgi:translation initiation factor IF-1